MVVRKVIGLKLDWEAYEQRRELKFNLIGQPKAEIEIQIGL